MMCAAGYEVRGIVSREMEGEGRVSAFQITQLMGYLSACYKQHDISAMHTSVVSMGREQ